MTAVSVPQSASSLPQFVMPSTLLLNEAACHFIQSRLCEVLMWKSVKEKLWVWVVFYVKVTFS